MADVLARGTNFPAELVTELVNLVQGKSSIAKLADQRPVAFSGTDIMTFTLDKEVDIVAENDAKTKGGATVGVKHIIPIKFEYGARVSDEFVYASEEKRLDYLRAFNEGFAKKMARGFDIAAFHGLNPRSAAASTVVNGNDLDDLIPSANQITATGNADADIASAIAKVVAGDYEITGIAASPAFSADLGATKVNGVEQYPELAWGANPQTVKGIPYDKNSTVSFDGTSDVYVGDFANMIKWGYARDVRMEVIEYGNPDNDATLGDLKGHNQVYLRAEMYLGWAILDEHAFAKVA